MTRNKKTNFTAKKNILAFVLAILMCISLCFAVACKNDDSSSKIPEYSYTDVDNGTIKNPNFIYGTVTMDYDEYPKTSVTGWNLNKNSSAKSGVIDVSTLGWKELMYNVYSDTGMMNYVKSLNGNFTDADIKQLIKDENITQTPKAEDVKKYVVENYLLSDTAKEGVTYAFENPGVPANATDKKIYMMNNYKTGDLGFGSIQTLTSASEVTLKLGEYAKITVSVKTANLNTTNSTAGYGEEIGANIRIKNSFNSNAQALFGIYNITCTEWTDYTFYVKADEVYETKFTVELGLGYTDHYAEGTVYFDDVRVEILDKDDVSTLTFDNDNIKDLDYNNLENNAKISAKDYVATKNYLYDMTVDMSALTNAKTDVSIYNDADRDFTVYKGGLLDGDPTGESTVKVESMADFAGVPYGISDGVKVEITNAPASYSLKLKDFEVNSENYVALTFFVKNQLNKLYATDITINVLDKYGSTEIERPAIAKLSDVSEDWVKLSILVKNNFDRVDYASASRYFDLEIVIGPDAEQDDIDAYAFGTVCITDPIVTTGVTYQYIDKAAEENKDQTENYDYYLLLNATATGSTALFAGSPNDYAADESDDTVYNMTVAPSDLGAILSKPAIPKNYTGVESGHYYVGGDEDNIDINTNLNSGIVNTKYLLGDDYKNNFSSEITSSLDHPADEEDIQVLMITPDEGKSYGYIGTANTIAANAYALISLKVKVTGGANAYIYLVDTTTAEKKILTFDAFEINTNVGYNSSITDKNIEEKDLFFNLSDTDGWVDLEFYIATGNTPKEFRLEFWNGSRSDTTTDNNTGFVFINDVSITTSGAFDEPVRWENSFTLSGTPLYDNMNEFIDSNSLIAYQRELTDREIEYNNDTTKKGENVKYYPKYIWAQTDNIIYAIYNTIDPTHYDPYNNEPIDNETEEDSLIKTDPATFWLSFSSIVLGVVLVLAIIMLFVKNIRRRHKANASDAKSHYTVKSRISKPKAEKKTKAKKEEIIKETVDEDLELEEYTSQINEQKDVEEQPKEETLDDYVYGDVQNFGEEENQETNQEEQEKNE